MKPGAGIAMAALLGALAGCTPSNPPGSASSTITINTRQSDGMIMVNIPEGAFMMGSEAGEPDEGPIHKVTLDAFWIDQTEITNAKYARCVETGICKPPKEKGSYTRSSYYDAAKYADFPVIFVDWSMAQAYCLWAGARLPSEAEWEKAARGENARIYPWGDAWDVGEHRRLNFADKNNPEAALDMTVEDGYRDTAPVGSYPDGISPYGVYDLAGNVWEWAADWYDPLYYNNSPSSNPSGPAAGIDELQPLRALRGGSWVASQTVFRTSNRNGLEPFKFSSSIGFRCAR